MILILGERERGRLLCEARPGFFASTGLPGQSARISRLVRCGPENDESEISSAGLVKPDTSASALRDSFANMPATDF